MEGNTEALTAFLLDPIFTQTIFQIKTDRQSNVQVEYNVNINYTYSNMHPQVNHLQVLINTVFSRSYRAGIFKESMGARN
jgi:hypothetical protein